MTQKKRDDLDEQAFWTEAQRRLNLVNIEPPVTLEQAERLLAALPPRGKGESLGEWLRRLRAASFRSACTVIPFQAKPRWHFTPLAQIRRLAAASSGGTEIPLPDPGRALETDDGRFRLTLSAEAGKIHLTLETLGLAVESLAQQRVGIAGPGGEDELIAIIELDEDGDGHCELEDRPEIRQALLHPIIGLIHDTG
jgi:hypothetical protein